MAYLLPGLYRCFFFSSSGALVDTGGRLVDTRGPFLAALYLICFLALAFFIFLMICLALWPFSVLAMMTSVKMIK